MDDQEQVQTEFRIPEPNMPGLHEKLQKLNRRAAKLGVAPIRYEVLRTEEIAVVRIMFGDDTGVLRERPNGPGPDENVVGYNKYFHVRVEGEPVRLAGWTFVATLQHVQSGENGDVINITRILPNETLPEKYRNVPPHCDHCRVNRFRRDTYVVRHDDGTHKQVGSDCLADFLGHGNPQNLAARAQWFADVRDTFSEFEGGSGNGIGSMRLDLETFLATTSAVIRKLGWRSRKEAKESFPPKAATAEIVVDEMIPPPNHRRLVTPDDADKDLAAKVIAWGEELHTRQEINDYLYNLRVVLGLKAIDLRMTGIAASAIAAYRREKEIETEKRERTGKYQSRHFGTVKKRAEYVLRVEGIRDLPGGDFGPVTLIRFRDDEGNLAVWFTGSPPREYVNGVVHEMFEIDTRYRVKATVKRHDKHHDVEQTVLTRVTVLERLQDEERREECTTA